MQWYDMYVSEKIYCILLATVTVEIATAIQMWHICSMLTH